MTKYLGFAIASLFALQLSGCGGGGGGGGKQTCSGAAPCGGTLDGTWQFQSICIGGDLSAMAAGEGLPSSCNSLYQAARYDNVSGTLTYAGGTETFDMTMTMVMEIFYSQSCASDIVGAPVTLNASVCASMQQSLLGTDSPFTSATCSFSGGGCKCTASAVNSDSGSDTYSVSGHTIVYSDGDSADYCVAGDVLTERQASADMGGLSMVATLKR